MDENVTTNHKIFHRCFLEKYSINLDKRFEDFYGKHLRQRMFESLRLLLARILFIKSSFLSLSFFKQLVLKISESTKESKHMLMCTNHRDDVFIKQTFVSV